MLSSGNGITANSECGLYDSVYTTTVEGTYLVDINAQTQEINTDFSTTFDVADYFEFDIIRTAPSKTDVSGFIGSSVYGILSFGYHRTINK